MRRDQLDRYLQYFYRCFRHLTFKKLVNWLQVEYRLLKNDSSLSDLFPVFLYIDISDKCNLRCPLCQMGQRNTISRENLMSVDNYRKCVTPVKDYLFQIFLYNWGEPFLNKDIYDIIQFNTESNISTVVSTNGNIPIDAEGLVKSGLDYLILSGDGITQEVYSKYRVGGSIDKVFANLQALVAAKIKLRSKYPIIEWQCLVSRYNEHDLAAIRKTVLAKGADRVRYANLNFFSVSDQEQAEKEWLPENRSYRSFESARNKKRRERGVRKPCHWLWRGCVINANGGIMPCCLYDIPDWGNVLQNGILQEWNSQTYQEARDRSKNKPVEWKQVLVCDTCTAPFIFK